jgi:starch synthase
MRRMQDSNKDGSRLRPCADTGPARRPQRILFVTSEVFPLAKVGGLGDVSAALPVALRAEAQDLRILLPAYRCVKERIGDCAPGPLLQLPGFDSPAQLWFAELEDGAVPLILLDVPELFDRPGGPYTDGDGREWPDNAERFLALALAAVAVATGTAKIGWTPDLVHGNDWPAGLLYPLLQRRRPDVPTVFTLHNMAHQGLTPLPFLERHRLPQRLGRVEAMEFYGRLSLLKGALVFADRLTTVSPSYAQEIQTEAFGCGLEGVARQRADALTGILNGVDYDLWDPRVDCRIEARYGPDTLYRKSSNKRALQRAFGLPFDEQKPLLGFIGRLVEQKGIDLLLEAASRIGDRAQWAVLGSGHGRFEHDLQRAAGELGGLAVRTNQDETLAHLIEAGADMIVMPSRYEPCGLNQLYGLRYGTIPVVHAVGGLRDTVCHVTERSLDRGEATGFVFEGPHPQQLAQTLSGAIECFAQPRLWRQLQHTGMRLDFGWRRSARAYVEVYAQAAEAAGRRNGRGAALHALAGRRAAADDALSETHEAVCERAENEGSRREKVEVSPD